MPLAQSTEFLKSENSKYVEVIVSSPHEDCDFKEANLSANEAEIPVEGLLNNQTENVSAADFDLLRVLGQYDFGKVFLVRKCRGRNLGSLFSLKVVRKGTLKVRCSKSTKADIILTSKLEHTFIAKLHFAFSSESKLYLVWEYLSGGDLFTRLSKQIMFTEEDVKFYLAEIVLAISHLHRLGILFCDLKRESVMLDSDGHVKLTDFGLIKEYIVNQQSDSTTKSSESVEYLAPEVISSSKYSTASDWWSFGVLMYEMLTGSLPFKGASREETVQQILRGKLSIKHFVSADALDLLRALLKRNPTSRLGYDVACDGEVQRHVFFSSVDWNGLESRKVLPPFCPVLHYSEKFCFDHEVTGRLPVSGVSSNNNPVAHDLFHGFAYVAPHLLHPDSDSDPSLDLELNNLPVSSKNTIGVSSKCLADEYTVLEDLSYGTHAVHKRVVQKATGLQFTMKTVERSRRDPAEEIDILTRFGHHPNIVRLLDVFDCGEAVNLILESVGGGQLFDRFSSNRRFSERETAHVTSVLARTLQFLHVNGVVHRDLKPCNIRFSESDSDCVNFASLKICEFDFAKQLRAENGLLMTPCYAASFVAPEVLERQGYSAACDIWSLGVLVFTMLAGNTPYAAGLHDSPRCILDRINSGTNGLRDTAVWKHISETARDFILGLLHVDPRRRLTAAQILQHEWIVNREQLNDVPAPLGEVDVEALKHAVNATFDAFASSNVPVLEPVSASLLAQRRRSRLQLTDG